MQENNGSPAQQNHEESEENRTDVISVAFYNHGLFCATHPRLVIFVSVIVIVACSAPLHKLPLFGGAVTAEWITLSPSELSLADSKGRTTKMLDDKENTIPRWFVGEPLLYVQQFVMAVHINPWRAGLLTNEMFREALKPAFNLSQVITDYTYKRDKQQVSLSDLCLYVTSQTPNHVHPNWVKYLPTNSCVVLSPGNFWDRNYTRFTSDFKIQDNLYQSKGHSTFPTSLKEFIFGVPMKHTGIYPAIQNNVGTDHTIRYAVTVLLKTHDASYLEGLKKELEKLHPLNSAGASHSHRVDSRDYVVHIYYKGESGSFIEIWHLCLMYFIVFLYLTFSVAKIEMVKSKIGLAFSAVITIMASLTMAAGLCSFFGLVPTLNSSEIFPYLVIVIGVENILVITNSVVSTPFHLDVELRLAQGLSKEGRDIVRNLVVETAVLVAGHFTYVPAVQEFCLFALVGLSTDFFLQMVFFATILSIDMRRLELSDLERITAYQQGLDSATQTVNSQQPSSPLAPACLTSENPVTVEASVSVSSPSDNSFTIVTSGSTLQLSSSSTVVAKQFPPSPPQFFKLLPPLPSVSYKKQTPSRCPIPLAARKLPKRLNFAYFVARTRVVQKVCMVCAVFYFLYMLSLSVTLLENEDTSSHVKAQLQNASSITSNFPVDVKSDFTNLKSKVVPKGETEDKGEEPSEVTPKHEKEYIGKEQSNNEKKQWKKTAEDDSDKTFDPFQSDGSGWYLMGRLNVLTAEEMWRSLSKRHLPQLLSNYNISLVGRYISVLPPVYLGTHLDTTTILSKYIRQQQSSSIDQSLIGDTASGDPIVEQEQSLKQESSREKANSEYFRHALYCVILGILVMILLFFICKFLNDCQIDPMTKLRGRGWTNREDLLESLPLILDGHMKTIEHLECLGSTIVSVCLGGRIWVWEASSGDCRKVMSRNSTPDRPSMRRRKKIERGWARKGCNYDPGTGAFDWERYSTTPPDFFSDSEGSVHQHTSWEDFKRFHSRSPPLTPRGKEIEDTTVTLETQKELYGTSSPLTTRSRHNQKSPSQIQVEQRPEMEEQSPRVDAYRTQNLQISNGGREPSQDNSNKTGGEAFASEKCVQYAEQPSGQTSHSKSDFRVHTRQCSDGSQDIAVTVNLGHPQNSAHVTLDSDLKENFRSHSRQRSDGSQDTAVTVNARHLKSSEGQIYSTFHSNTLQPSDGSQNISVTMNASQPHVDGHKVHHFHVKDDFRTHSRSTSDGSKDILVPNVANLCLRKSCDPQKSIKYRDTTSKRSLDCQQKVESYKTVNSGLVDGKNYFTDRRQASDSHDSAARPADLNLTQTLTEHMVQLPNTMKQKALRKQQMLGSDGHQAQEKSISNRTVDKESGAYHQRTDSQSLYIADKTGDQCQQNIYGKYDLTSISCTSNAQTGDVTCEAESDNPLTSNRRGSVGRMSSGYHSNSNENVAVASTKHYIQDTAKKVKDNSTQNKSYHYESTGNTESGGKPSSAVFDFKKYITGTNLRYTSSRASLGSWSSGSDDSETEWPSCSEASYDDVQSPRGSGRTSDYSNYRETPFKPSPVVWCLCCNGDFVVTGCSDGSVEFWSISSGRLVCCFTDSTEGVTSVSFLTESFRLVVARLDGCLDFLVLTGPTGNTQVPQSVTENSPVNRSSPRNKKKNNDESCVGVKGSSPTVIIACHLIQRVRAHLKPVSFLRVLGGRVITGSQDRTIKVYRTDECTCVYTLYGHGDGITALFVDKTHPCTVVSGAANGGVRVWDIQSGECLSHLRGHLKAVVDVTCTSVHLISVSLDNVMCIWDREHNTCLHRIVQFPGLCSNVIILSKDLFVTGGQGCLMLWDISSGRRIRTIPLGNDDASVFVRRVRLSGNATIVCDYGKELRVLTFPALLNKSE